MRVRVPLSPPPGLVAQLAEQLSCKQQVASSNLAWASNNLNKGGDMEENKPNEPSDLAKTISEFIRIYGILERLAWLKAQDYANELANSIDKRVVLSDETLQKEMNDVVNKVMRFIYNNDTKALDEVVDRINLNNTRSSIIT